MNRLKEAIKRATPEPVWAALKRTRFRYEMSRFQPYQARHIYCGFPLEVSITESLAQGWYDHDWPNLAELDLLQTRKLRAGARVFDLGAHQCVVALMLSRIVGPEGRVLAVEAFRHHVEVGNRNRELNAAPNLEILHGAVAAKSGQIAFSWDSHVDNPAQKSAKDIVNAYSIDDLAARYGVPDVLFIDVEGYECEALRGARETLRHKPDCFVEVHAGVGLENFGGSVKDVLSYFPVDQFDLFGSVPGGTQYTSLTPESEYLGRHFYMVALAK